MMMMMIMSIFLRQIQVPPTKANMTSGKKKAFIKKIQQLIIALLWNTDKSNHKGYKTWKLDWDLSSSVFCS